MKPFVSFICVVILMANAPVMGEEQCPLKDLPPIASDAIRVYFIRHAETHHNVNHSMARDSELYFTITDKGKAQSRVAGEALTDYPIAAAYTSETDRTWKTLEFSGLVKENGIPVKQDPAFNQMRTGLKENGDPYALSERIALWREGYDRTPKEGESLTDSTKRVFDRIRKMDDAYGKAVVVVTHGDILAGVAGSADETPSWRRWDEYQTGLGSLTIIDVFKTKPVILRVFNFSPELEEKE